MKKTISILLSILCVIALAGCSDHSPSNSQSSNPLVSTAEPSSTPLEAGLQRKVSQPDASAASSVPSSVPPEPGILKKKLPSEQTSQTGGNTKRTVNIQVGNKNFTATLYDNAPSRALLAKLPLTLKMDELNGNEKFYYFSEKFPANSERVGNIKSGDLMLYGSDCLVLFYKNFSTSYSYTRLGYVEDASGLAAALGSGSVQVTFSAR